MDLNLAAGSEPCRAIVLRHELTGAVSDKLLPRQSQAMTANDSSQELVWSCLPFGIQQKQMDSSLKSLVGWLVPTRG